MSDLISRKALVDHLKKSFIAVNYHPDLGDPFIGMQSELRNEFIADMIQTIEEQPSAYDVDEIRLLKNYLSNMPKVYSARNQNWVVVRDLLMQGTSTAGMTSCIAKCRELGIDPYGHNLKGVVKE